MTATKYTTYGSVCGGCDHKHMSVRTAQDCADKHHRGIQNYNGNNSYSDRKVHRTDCPEVTHRTNCTCDFMEVEYDW